MGTVLLLYSTGCEGMKFAKYQGEQKAWPTGTAFSDKVYAVPVFRGWPEKPYDILGRIEFSSPGVDWNEGDVKQAAAKAKELGGDAIMMVPKGDPNNQGMANLSKDIGLSGGGAAALVLKWRTVEASAK